MIILFTTLGKSPNGIIPFNIVSFSIISKLEVINTHGKSISRLSGPFHFVNINKWLLCLLFLSNVCVQESATVWTTASQSSTSTSPTKTSPLISFVSSRATPDPTSRCSRYEAWTTPWTSTSSAPNVQTLSVSKWCFPECSKRTSSSGCTSPSCPGTLTHPFKTNQASLHSHCPQVPHQDQQRRHPSLFHEVQHQCDRAEDFLS